ncbi:hypothetical protein SAMN04488057_105211 [Cyclobacterium lianum]|uniref:TonB protein C-terminal n=1 Tax=Cyclobacterium lianum TaxID=388280 RepID=A0A1M7NCZ4_9BACT|nr:hypothetical protein [Cyclobacterium lianum]SHN01405.1 hypothetical protein SAMN04488057_105211 [Cyclobacterium lianum]
MIRVLIIFIFCIPFLGCSNEYLDKKGMVIESHVVPGPRGFGFTDVAQISFENNGTLDTITIRHTGIKLNTGDSVLFSLNVNKPRSSKLKQIAFRHNGSEAYISIDPKTEKLYQYYVIDKKPLFQGAMSYMENDSLVPEFLKKELLQIQPEISGRNAIYLIIDEQGKAFVEEIIMADDTTEKNLRKIIENMPLFEPGEHNGVKVKVSYLVEIK